MLHRPGDSWFLTAAQAAAILRVATVTMWRAYPTDHLPVYRFGNVTRWKKADLIAYLGESIAKKTHRARPRLMLYQAAVPAILTIPDVATVLNVSRAQAYRLRAAKLIRTHLGPQFGGQFLVNTHDLEEYTLTSIVMPAAPLRPRIEFF